MNDIKDQERINEFIEAIMKVARGDYSVQVELTEDFDHLDALGIGINMMVDDLKKSHATALENDRITLLNSQLMEAKAKAEESDRLKSAFLANMSHEIRTPMNGILGFAGLLKDPFLSHEDQQKYIEILEKSGRRLLNLINDLIDISKIESGQMRVTNSETNIYNQAEYIYNFFKPETESRGLHLVFNPSMEKEYILNTDREKLYAIMSNLVKNAIKYSEKGTIEIGYRKKESLIEFYIKDNGIGIPADMQNIIFDRFVQTSDTSTRAHDGVGLGLAICKAYVEMLGGKIWVESEEDKGSVFYFTIPDKENHPLKTNDIGQKPAINEQIRKLKILIVEDDLASEMLLSIALKKFSRETIVVRNGIDAVKTMRNIPDIDLIMMDYMLPGQNGYESTKQIKQFNKQVKIIAQTACGFLSDRVKAIEAGCDDYISKPINGAELNILISTHFQKK